MPRGRKPTGDRALRAAERQARYRAAIASRPMPPPAALRSEWWPL
jgi:hypothetical protein